MGKSLDFIRFSNVLLSQDPGKYLIQKLFEDYLSLCTDMHQVLKNPEAGIQLLRQEIIRLYELHYVI
jgi:hypothetical protein